MPEDVAIVWDLETVRDLAAARRMLNMAQASEAEVRAALGACFPKHPLHKIACIGALVVEREPGPDHPGAWPRRTRVQGMTRCDPRSLRTGAQERVSWSP